MHKLGKFAQLYLTALQQHLQEGRNADLEPARVLGRHAMSTGKETLDLARIHEATLTTLMLPHDSARTRESMIRRASAFFGEVITPIEETHRGAQEANAHLKSMISKLTQRTKDLATSNEQLQSEILQRKAVEDSLRTSEQTASKLLTKSRQMQEELRHLSRQLLSAQEEERRKISRELHDVIAQTLTSINVRLAALKTFSAASTKQLHQKIAATQRLVERSVNIVHRFARELRPAVLDDLGLIPALHSFMKTFTKDTGVRVSLEAFAGIEKTNESQRTVLYRVAQEALSNVARHAQADHVVVRISKVKSILSMEVADNGKGFDVDGSAGVGKHSRLGLLGMRERVPRSFINNG